MLDRHHFVIIIEMSGVRHRKGPTVLLIVLSSAESSVLVTIGIVIRSKTTTLIVTSILKVCVVIVLVIQVRIRLETSASVVKVTKSSAAASCRVSVWNYQIRESEFLLVLPFR